ncbi:branched-chain amino acid transaminase [Flavobacterium sangjuense]|uniref:Branched-chain-amino-acid aminotransferase n=1 Tax=Flavobacterium sangjuense TaxID=2518177 RepID=A0A4P7PVV1_9FLAO|nr:branched-chain amino acid transaminase [Flavobacterium sangjuense]QBZ99149.1 Branched-chain-amino-acid aminotransferase [Flavobacterium sangjuense]
MYFNEQTTIYLNGEFVKATKATTDLYGQTLHYGYGVFEGIRAYNTENGVRVFKATEHYERLKNSCQMINIPFDYDIDDLIEQTYKVLEVNNFKDAYVRPLIFCSPNMGLTKPNGVSILICAWEWGAYLGDNLLNVTISSFCRPHPKSTKIEAKVCGHYINSILATTEAKEKGFDEAILLDTDGFLAEGPGSNLFFEKGGKLFTPKTGNILPGITRATVIKLCQDLEIELTEGAFLPEDLANADAAFLCGTAAEIIGLQSFEKKSFPKNWNETLGKKLQTAYKNLVLEKELQETN